MTRRDLFTASAAAALTAAPPVNLLFLMTDQHRFDALSCAGNQILRTPNIDRLAREGAMFRNAMTACPVCVPARTSMLTGKSFANSRVYNNTANQDLELDPGPSFDNLLHDRGYRSEYYGKWHSPYRMTRTYDNRVAAFGLKEAPAQRQLEIDNIDRHVPQRPLRPGEFLSRDFRRPYTPAAIDLDVRKATGADPAQGEVYGHLDVPREYTATTFAVDQAIAALERMKDKPFSLTCSIEAPHPPQLNVDPYWGMYPPAEMPLPKNFLHNMSDSPYRAATARMQRYRVTDNVRDITSIYYGMVKEVDDNIGRLLRRLDELKLTDRTLVVFTSDHGEMLGAHGMYSKFVFYEESVHVPMLLRLPGVIRPGTVVADPVSNMDLFATILDYLNVSAPARDGDSLRSLIEGRAGGADYRVSEWPNRAVPNFMVRAAAWKLMIADSPDSSATDALYDLKNDPGETRNLLSSIDGRTQYAAAAAEMKERLIHRLERVHSPKLEGVKQRKLT